MRPMHISHADSAACVRRIAGTNALLQAGRCGRRAPPQADSGACGVGSQMALVDVPDISFDLNFLGGDVSAVPGLESWLNGLVYQNVIRCAARPAPWPRTAPSKSRRPGGRRVFAGPRSALRRTRLSWACLPAREPAPSSPATCDAARWSRGASWPSQDIDHPGSRLVYRPSGAHLAKPCSITTCRQAGTCCHQVCTGQSRMWWLVLAGMTPLRRRRARARRPSVLP